MADVTLKAGDTTPEFEEQLIDESGSPVDLTGNETIKFYMEGPSDSSPMTPNTPGDGPLVVNADMSVNVSTATVSYDFGKGDTTYVGTHLAEIVVTFGDGEVRTWPNGDKYYTIDVAQPVNRDATPENAPDKDITVGTITADLVNATALKSVETLAGPITDGRTVSDLYGSQSNPIPEQYVKSSNVDELLVGQTGPVTGIWGDSKELVGMRTTSMTKSKNFTQNSFGYIFTSFDIPNIPTRNVDYTGISKYYIGFTAVVGNGGGGTTTARLFNWHDATISYTGSTINNVGISSLAEIDPTNVDYVNTHYIEAKVDGGTGYVKNPAWFILGEIA